MGELPIDNRDAFFSSPPRDGAGRWARRPPRRGARRGTRWETWENGRRRDG